MNLDKKENWWLTPHLQTIIHKSPSDRPKIHWLLKDYVKHYLETLRKYNPLSAAATLHSDVERAFYKHYSETEENRNLFTRIACREGCYYCCLQYVIITEEEALLIKQYCKEKKIKINKKLMMQQRKRETLEWQKAPEKQMRCAFLGDDNKCTIYPVRPASCRKYYVIDDAESCNPKTNPGGTVKNIISPMSEIIASAAMNATKKCGSLPKIMLEVL